MASGGQRTAVGGQPTPIGRYQQQVLVGWCFCSGVGVPESDRVVFFLLP